MPWILLHQTWQTNLLWPMTLQYQNRDDLYTTTQNLADEPTLVNEPPGTRAEMTCIPLHKTWQTNLLWPMTLQYQNRDDLYTTTQSLADEPTLANGPPSTRTEMTYIQLHKTWQMNLLWPMYHPSTRAEITCIPLHKTWQMNLLWLNTMAKLWKL